MISKKKVYKIIISAIALFAFVYWGLDPKLLCDTVSTTPDTCAYNYEDTHSWISGVNLGFKIMLTSMLIPPLIMWIMKK